MEQMFFPGTQKKASQTGAARSSAANKNALFPTQLRKLRKEKGVSQEELSKELGISKSTLGLWETGDTLPDARSLHDLAVYYNVSADYLLGLAELKTPDIDIQKACKLTGLSDDAIHILQEFYAAEALNEFLYEKSFRDLLLCLSSYKKAAIAERIYSRILNGTANQDALVNALNSIIENNDLSEDFVDALKTCIVLHSNRKDIRLSTFDSVFSPVDIYEVYANRSLTELINTIAGDAPFSAKELAENAGINLPPIDAEGHYW